MKSKTAQTKILAVLAIIIFSSFAFGQETDVRELKPNQNIEREMTGKETHRYKFKLKTGEFFQVRVEQKGVDVMIKLLSVDSKTLATMDSPNSKQGLEILSFIAERSGNYRLDVSGFDEKAEKGVYTIKRGTSRKATARDKRRVEIEKLFVEGMTARDIAGKSDISIQKLEEALAGWKELNDEYLIKLTTQQVNQLKQTKADAIFAEARKLAIQGLATSMRGSLPKFEKARLIYRQIKNKQYEAYCLGWLGSINNYLGEKQKALDYYNQALPLRKEVGDKSGLATTLTNIGGVYSSLGEKQKALDYYNQALPLRKEVGDKSGLATTLTNIGLVYDSLGEKQKALDYYNQALPLRKEVGDKSGLATTLTNIGLVYSSLGETQKALDYYNQALPLRKEVGDKSGLATTLNNIGGVYSSLGEKQKALDYYNQALPLYRTVGDKSGLATTLNNIGGVYSSLGEKQKALDYYNQALPLRKEVGDKSGLATTLTNIGLVYSSLGEKQKALDYYNQALPLRKEVGDKSGLATTLTNIGGVYSSLGEKQKALDYYNQALPLTKEVGDKRGLATTLTNIGLVYDDLGEKQKALDYYNQALPLTKEVGDKSGLATTLTNIGGVYDDLGEKQKALDYYNQALPLTKEVGDKSGLATTLTNIGGVYDDLGEKQKALDYYNQALPLTKEVGDKSGLATTLNNIGGVYSSLGEKQKALDYYNQALPLYRTVGDKSGLATTLTNIGAVYSSLGEKQKALDYYNQALPLTKEVGDKSGLATTLTNIGGVYDDLGEKQKALDYYNQALPLTKEVGDKSGLATTLTNIGAVYSSLGEKEKALEYFQKALPLRKYVGDIDGQANTLNWLSFYWNNLKNPRFAVFYGKQSVNLYQQLRQNIKRLDKELQKKYLGTVEHTYRNLADILIEQGRIAEAEQVLGMLKEEEYFSYLRRDDKLAADLKGRISLSPDEKKAFEDYEKFADEITKAAQVFSTLEKKKNALPLGQTLSAEDQKQFDQLKAKYESALTVFNKFLDDLKVRFSKNDVRVARIASDTQGLLKKLNQPRTVIISTIVGKERLNLIVTTSDIQKAHTLEVKSTELNKLALEFRNALKDPLVDPRPLGKKIYDKLFPKALQKDLENIKADTIVWSLDGTLRYIPMATLWDGESYLVEKYNQAVITLASRDKLESQANTGRSKWQAFGVGVSKKFENFNKLPSVPKELCSVIKDDKKKDFCKTFGQEGVFKGLMLRDEEFTLKNFQEYLGRTPIVHIASHFALKAGDYKDSYLLLGGGQNRRYSLADLRKVSNLGNIELLTLSACNTAMTSGVNSNGVEVEGFGALAQEKGVKSVLATLWAVADDSTGKLMTDFYKILEENPKIGKAEALRIAQLKMIKGNYKTIGESTKRGVETFVKDKSRKQIPFKKDDKAQHKHPYFWSPFVLIGNWK